ncbi:MAG: glutamate-1-semialdehyde 2,1-aminomutase [Planctomycetota bacterium]|nr:glutamate-1-semialdehyde 2,1-aminomutase [Planctomycetota bacterium]
MPRLDKSQAVFDAAQRLIPGGVNSPVRAYKTVGGVPPHIASAEGARVTDLDGNEYIDMVLAYGPMIVGHGHPEVRAALHDAIDRGTAFGAPTAGELSLARKIIERVPGCEVVRLVNSGTEATMSAARLARAATGRDRLLKFEGCYHGHGDSFLVQAGSGALTLGAPDSPGVPAALAELTSIAPFNDLDAVRALFADRRAEFAAIFVEPVAGNIGCIPPAPGFLEGLRELCDAHGALLVFDEVMTGFRVSRGGYSALTDVRADLVTLGKVIGGGLPIGAYGGRADLMQQISPAGDVYQAGTLSGNPIAVAAGEATLDLLDRRGVYEGLEEQGARLQAGLEQAAREAGVPAVVQRQGSMLCLYLREAPAVNMTDVTASDRERWTRFFQGMLERGVLLPPSPYEAWFLSTAHDAGVVDEVVAAAEGALAGA